MGKKRIIKKSSEELIQARESVERAVEREKVVPPVGVSRKHEEGIAYIRCSYNNTLITITDTRGNTLVWSSAGNIGFQGAKKSTPFAASKVAETTAERAKRLGIARLHVFVRGIGRGRESAIRSLAARGLDILSIRDATPIPHGGVKPPKVRRV